MGIRFDQQIIDGAHKTPQGKILSWAGIIPKSSSSKGSQSIDFNKKSDGTSENYNKKAYRFRDTSEETEKPTQKPSMWQRFKNWWNGTSTPEKVNTKKDFSDIRHSDGTDIKSNERITKLDDGKYMISSPGENGAVSGGTFEIIDPNVGQ